MAAAFKMATASAGSKRFIADAPTVGSIMEPLNRNLRQFAAENA